MNFRLLIFCVLYQPSYTSSKITAKDYNLMPDLFQFDDYDKCLLDTEDEASYCTVTVKLHPQNNKNVSEVWRIIQDVSSSDKNYRHDLLRHGICVSTHCVNYNGTIYECLSESYSTKYKNVGLVGQIKNMRCFTKNTTREIGIADMIVLVLLVAYILFVLIATAWLEYNKYQARRNSAQTENIKSIRSLLSAFSLVDNLSSLSRLHSKTEKQIVFLETMKIIASFVAIVVHVGFHARCGPISNFWQIEKETGSWLNLLLVNGGMLIQLFFVISSWLLAVSFFKKLRREGVVHLDYVVRCIVRRYFRFATAEIISIALHSTWLVHFFHDTFLESQLEWNYKMCREKWWKNLLFLNNFGIENGICLFHTWYLSVDFQLFILGLLVLWLTQKKLKHLLLALAVLCACQVVFMFIYLAWKNFEIAVALTPELYYGFTFVFMEEWHANWTSASSNLPGLVFGLLFGFLHVKYEKDNFFTNAKIAVLWCILTIFLFAGTPCLSSYYLTTHHYGTSKWLAAAYGSINKTMFVLGVGLFIFGLAQGLGGLVKKAMEWAPLHNVGQLTFGVYLIHMTLLEIDVALRRTPQFVSDYTLMCGVIVNVVLAYIISIVFTVFVLTPMDKLSRKLLGVF